MNIYLVYYELKTGQFTNGQTVQCDTVHELLYQLREFEKNKGQNLIILTITNGKPQ